MNATADDIAEAPEIDVATKAQIEDVMRQIPGYNPWDHADAIGAWVDHAAALHAINWFAERLRHIEGSAAGELFELRTWQAAVIANLIGWKRLDEKGRVVRRYRKCLLYIPRGNGKTPLAAGIVLFCFFNDGERGAQCYLAAGEKSQAGYLFRNAVGFIDQDAELQGAVTVYRGDQHRQFILNADPLSFCKVIPSEAAKQHGGIPHVIGLDELHTQQNGDLLEVFETGMRKQARCQPLLMMLTTAAEEGENVCNDVHAYASRVRDNGGHEDRPGFDPTFLPVIYEARPEDDWRDPAVHAKANPNLGISVSREEIEKACREAQEDPKKENGFRRLHLNQRTAKSSRLIPLDQWDKCHDLTLSLDALAGSVCYGGLDLSSKEDLTSFALVFPLADDEVAAFVWSWCPESKVAQRSRRKVPYDVWAKAGHIEATPGNSIDYSKVRERIVWAGERFQVQMIYADPAMVRETATILIEQHGFADRFVEFAQTMNNLSAATKDLIFRVKHGKLRHNANPVTRWAVGNVCGFYKGKIPPGQSLVDHLDKVPIIPSKQQSADKIDPVAAIVNALAAKASNPVAAGGGASVYENRGVYAF